MSLRPNMIYVIKLTKVKDNVIDTRKTKGKETEQKS